MAKLTFVTCANEAYYKFVAPFIFSCLHQEPEALVEIFVSDINLLKKKYKQSLDLLNDKYGDQFLLTEACFEGIMPNTVRFVNTPSRKSDYVYIVDIDIFYTQAEIFTTLVNATRRANQPFSNIVRVRENEDRLSGLHFTEWDALYPLPDFSDLDLLETNDEVVLFNLVSRKTGKEPRRDLEFRPAFGIHMSPNRPMFATSFRKIHWNLTQQNSKGFLNIISESFWQSLFATFDDDQQKSFDLLCKECISMVIPSMFPRIRPDFAQLEPYDNQHREMLISKGLYDDCYKYMKQWYEQNKGEHSFLNQLSWSAAASNHLVESIVYLSEALYLQPSKAYLQRLLDVARKYEQQIEKEPLSQATIKFTEKYVNNSWQSSESRSGPSSTLARTESLRNALPACLEKLNVKVLLDAPCGDLNWMKTLLPELNCKYLGADIVPQLVQDLNKRFGALDNATFHVLDITSSKLPYADLMLCRDCLFHLSYADIAKFLKNFLKSKIKYLMTTSHINSKGFTNQDIITGDWRWFDLFLPPFNFPHSYKMRIEDGGGDRYLYVWPRRDIRKALAKLTID